MMQQDVGALWRACTAASAEAAAADRVFQADRCRDTLMALAIAECRAKLARREFAEACGAAVLSVPVQ
jgi:hypothetical protein